MFAKVTAIYLYIAFGFLALGIPMGEPSVGLGLLIIGGVVYLLRRPKDALRKLTTDIPKPILAFILWFPINILLAINRGYSAEVLLGYGLVIIASMLSMKVFVRLPEPILRYEKITFIIGSYLTGFYTFYSHFVLHNARAVAPSTDENQTGTLLIIVIALTIGFIQSAKTVKERIAAILLLPLSLAGLMLTESRGAWIGAIGVLIYYFVSNKLSRYLSLGITAISGIAVMVIPTIKVRFVSIFNVNTSNLFDWSGDRIYLWKSAINIMRDYPIFGVGGGNFPNIYPKYRLPNAVEPNNWHAHNIFLQIGSEFGLVGLALFLWIIASAIKDSFGLAKRSVMGHAIFAALIGVLVHQLVDATIVTFEISATFWILLGLIYAWHNECRTKDGVITQ